MFRRILFDNLLSPTSIHQLKISLQIKYLQYAGTALGWPSPTSQFSAQSTYFPRDETGLVCLLTQLERTLQLYW
jgi:hypothetical protein